MSYLKAYKRRVSKRGTTYLENSENQGREHLEREFTNIAGYNRAILNKDGEIDIIVESTQNSLNKYALLRPSAELKNGDYLTFNKQTWIVRSTDYANLNPKSEIFLCNQKLTLKNPYIQIPCYINTTTYGTKGVVSAEKFYESDSKIKMYIQRNELTEGIKEGYRFILTNRYVYKVTGIEDVTYPGMFTITCEHEESLEMDDFANNLAYNDGDTVSKPATKVEIVGETQIKKSSQYTYQLSNQDIMGEWSIDDETLATIEQVNGNEITLKTSKKSGWIELKFVARDSQEPIEVIETKLDIMIY